MTQTGDVLNNYIGSFVFIGSATLASQTTVTFSSFPSAYNSFLFTIDDCVLVTANDKLFLVYSNSGGAVIAGYTGFISYQATTATAFTGVNLTTITGTSYFLDNAANIYNANLYVFGGSSGVSLLGQWHEITASPRKGFAYQFNASAAPISSMTFSTNSGNGWSAGRISLYGINGS